MLVKFKTTAAYPEITMFGDVALKLLEMMGRRETVPSAIGAEDIPQSLQSLREGIAAADAALEDQPPGDEGEGDERRVSLHNRAVPLIEMLEAAEREGVAVMWE
ncbi:MAG: DUF1840 domain-containing protein [Gammaproteobacteria bacterium]|jgi:hypothetical protein|nr:DUF1840 domain-containing protein [Gammaproteobacteria bacterium]MDH3757694.1 DUF1840 domain-containing protein [Gammaproteobacteria bacterium]MDH3848422.1 DUF1840 domain-containing protein [Gammaproteobacteria bacterium]MDH3906211.1 DUF1840 domain-containing protein [Gammaproteobacteria bacterium]MDH3909024.1 DUF1840 domain-containing protein [Gammaproteobacteria bacterium]